MKQSFPETTKKLQCTPSFQTHATVGCFFEFIKIYLSFLKKKRIKSIFLFRDKRVHYNIFLQSEATLILFQLIGRKITNYMVVGT